MSKHYITTNTSNLVTKIYSADFTNGEPENPSDILLTDTGDRHIPKELRELKDPKGQWKYIWDGSVMVLDNGASQEVELLAKLKEDAKNAVFTRAEFYSSIPYDKITKAESDSWSAKAAEYDAYVLDNSAITPIFDKEVVNRGISKEDLMTLKVAPKVATYRTLVAAIVSVQSIMNDDIVALVDISEVEAYLEVLEETFNTKFTTFNI